MEKKRINSKAKGGTLERKVVNDLKPFFPFAKTSRLGDKLLDNCGVDICKIPYLIQCKSGYNKVDFKYKYEDMYLKVRELLSKNYPPEDPIHNYPYVIVHQKTGIKGKKEPELFQVTMDYETFLKLVSK